MKRENLFLAAYYAALLIAPMGNLRFTILTGISILLSLIVFFLYSLVKDEVLFYLYNFVALIGIIIALGEYNPYSPVTIAVAYIILSLLLLHITYARFYNYFRMLRRETLIYTLLSLPISFFSVYLFLIYPIGYGFWGVFVLVILSVVIIALLMRSSESENGGNSA